jgi:hypothetical protein
MGECCTLQALHCHRAQLIMHPLVAASSSLQHPAERGLWEEAYDLMSSRARARQAPICMAAQGAMESNIEVSSVSGSGLSVCTRTCNRPLTAWPRPVPSTIADLGRFSRRPRGGRLPLMAGDDPGNPSC